VKFGPLRGFRDYLPPDAAARADLFWTLRQVARRAGFAEVETPSVEAFELFRVKSGTALLEQSFRFQDKGGREVTLIPENTPALARLVAQRAKGETWPVKWFSLPKLWRYEEPQSGRTREFSQCVLDIFGVPGIEAELDILTTLNAMLSAVGLEGRFFFHINDRRLMEGLATSLGVGSPEAFFHLLDRRDKLSGEEFRTELQGLGLSPEARTRLEDLMPGTHQGLFGAEAAELLDRLEATPGMSADGREGADSLRQILRLGASMGLKEVLRLDITVVRGLAYYTSTVVEAFDRQGELRAVFGGGRYDHLVELFGGPPTPAFGVAIGDQTLELLLRAAGRWPMKGPRPQVYVAATPEIPLDRVLRIVHELRRRGLRSDWDLLRRSLSRQVREASHREAEFLVVLGPRELAAGQVGLKNMQTGQQESFAEGELVPRLEAALQGGEAASGERTSSPP
jgi:histidyl-tRNA synthetase